MKKNKNVDEDPIKNVDEDSIKSGDENIIKDVIQDSIETVKKIKLSEIISFNLRKKWLLSGTTTLLLVIILFLAFMSLNLFIANRELPEIDVTKNKLYSLSEDSKKALAKVNQDVKIYVYGYNEDSQLIKFLKKYTEANEKISYEILTEETNYEKIK